VYICGSFRGDAHYGNLAYDSITKSGLPILLNTTTHGHIRPESDTMLEVKNFDCGFFHGAFITTNNEVYTTGCGVFGQLAQNNVSNNSSVVKVHSELFNLYDEMEIIEQVICAKFTTFFLSRNGRVFCAGEIAQRFVGMQADRKYSKPCYMQRLETDIIKQVATFSTIALFLTSRNEIVTDEDICPTVHESFKTRGKRVQILADIFNETSSSDPNYRIVKIAVHTSNIYIVTQSGKVFVIGLHTGYSGVFPKSSPGQIIKDIGSFDDCEGYYYLLRGSTHLTDEIYEIEFPHSGKYASRVTDIEVSDNIIMCLSELGQVTVWGLVDKATGILPDNERINRIINNPHLSIHVEMSGDVLYERDSQILLVTTQKFYNAPQIIPYFEKNHIQIIQVALGQMHSVFLSVDGFVYTCGSSEELQNFVTMKNEFIYEPRLAIEIHNDLLPPENNRIQDIRSGGRFVYARTGFPTKGLHSIRRVQWYLAKLKESISSMYFSDIVVLHHGNLDVK
jgi:alpha-tubulin suppressor-like RCC1 family protein